MVELAQGWPAPLCGKLLADLGAEVRKIEMPDTIWAYGITPEHRRASYAIVNSGKRLLRSDDGAPSSARPLVESADVVLVDEAGARVLRSFVGLERPAAAVWCEMLCAPYEALGEEELGTTGGKQVADLLLQAASGLLAITGDPDRPPLRAGVELSASIGALFGLIGVLAALIGRDRTGVGQHVAVSLPDALTVSATNFVSRVAAGEPPLERLGNQGPNTAPWNLFETKDGTYVYIAAGNDASFRRLCHAMGRDELAEDEELATEDLRRRHGRRLTATVAEWMATQGGEGVVELLATAGVPARPVRPLREVLAEEASRPEGMVRTTHDQHGTAWQTAGNPLGLPDYAVTRVEIPHPVIGAAAAGTDRTAETHRTAGTRETARPHACLRQPVMAAADRPLAGVKVIELGVQTAGPYCGRILADLGADVLKVEPAKGEQGRRVPPFVDGASVFFDISNAGKRGRIGDVDRDADLQRLHDDLMGTDIFLSNLSGAWLAAHRLDPVWLARSCPDLVVTCISGFGSEGPKKDLKAYDTVVQADAGLMSVTGYPGGAPMKTGISSADFLGALGATAGSLSALYGVRRGLGTPRVVDAALSRMAVWATQMLWPWAGDRTMPVERIGNRHWTYSPHGLYRCRDALVVLACACDGEWHRLCDLVAEPETAPGDLRAMPLSRRLEERDQLDALVECFTSQHSADVVIRQLAAVGIAAAKVTTIEERLLPRDTGRWRLMAPVKSASGRMTNVTILPIRMSSGRLVPLRGAPPLGPEQR